MQFKKRFISILALAGVLSLSACGNKTEQSDNGGNQGGNTNPPTPAPVVVPDNFESVQEFEAPVDMHTPEQKAFVDYKETGNYEDLTSARIQEITGQNSGGRLNLSAPAGIPVSFTYKDPEEIDHYVLEVSKDEKFEEGVHSYEGAATDTSITAYNL